MTTPATSGSRSRRLSTALKAPRALNEPVSCSDSGLTINPGEMSVRNSGVLRTWPSMRAAARRISARCSAPGECCATPGQDETATGISSASLSISSCAGTSTG